MGTDTFNRTLRTNHMIFNVRRDMALVQKFKTDLEGLMDQYKLPEVERDALRHKDLRKLRALGVHPFFLAQMTRLYYEWTDNQQREAAMQAVRELIEDRD